MSDLVMDIEKLKVELERLSATIAATINEIRTVRHPLMLDDRVNGAVDELAAIVQDTETATDTILDAAEAIEALALTAVQPDGSSLREALTEATTKIFEACNFQDLSGQRISKVTTLLRDIDERLASIISAIGVSSFTQGGVAAPEGDAALLNGPALGNGLGQDSIDALLN